tara:strand:- start:5096 stop:5488 length:393 start_codon:yes stop_codon:yes gene_type:complete
MVWLKAAKEIGKAALKTKTGKKVAKKATMEVGKHLKMLQEGMKDARKTFKASYAKSKEEERKAYRNIGLTLSGLLGAGQFVSKAKKWKKSSVNKIQKASNAATKADAIAKIQKATKNNTAAQRFKNRVKK